MTLIIIGVIGIFLTSTALGFTIGLYLGSKRYIAHLDNDIKAHTPDDAEKVGMAILERGRVILDEDYELAEGQY